MVGIMDRATSPQVTAPTRADDSLEATGYLLLSAVVDGHAGPPSTAKRALVAALKAGAGRLRRDLFANVGILTARRLAPRADPLEPPDQATPGRRYDVAVLLQAPTVDSARWLRADPAFADLRATVALAARGRTHVAVIRNVRRSHCEYGAQSRRLYLLMNYPGDGERDVVPAWGWTHRPELLCDLAFSRDLRRFRRSGTGPGRCVLYGLA